MKTWRATVRAVTSQSCEIGVQGIEILALRKEIKRCIRCLESPVENMTGKQVPLHKEFGRQNRKNP